mmetsp:Transcript_7854/g.19508  ORF Transcript_7854/g.19508 Transcript_7854/m.19508 type:complete len:106 (+) Transcript_7854:126-443(+)
MNEWRNEWMDVKFPRTTTKIARCDTEYDTIRYDTIRNASYDTRRCATPWVIGDCTRIHYWWEQQINTETTHKPTVSVREPQCRIGICRAENEIGDDDYVPCRAVS